MECVRKSVYNGQFAIALDGNITSVNAPAVEEAIKDCLRTRRLRT